MKHKAESDGEREEDDDDNNNNRHYIEVHAEKETRVLE
jgi:hypothetical protein